MPSGLTRYLPKPVKLSQSVIKFFRVVSPRDMSGVLYFHKYRLRKAVFNSLSALPVDISLTLGDQDGKPVVHGILEGRVFQDTLARFIDGFRPHVFHHCVGCNKCRIKFPVVVFQHLFE